MTGFGGLIYPQLCFLSSCLCGYPTTKPRRSTARPRSPIDAFTLRFFFFPLFMQLPYDETTTDGREALQEFRLNEDVALLRDAAEADLVQMIGDFNDGYCGWG